MDKKYNLILINDEINTLDHVVNAISMICCFTKAQAEQIAMLADYKGSA